VIHHVGHRMCLIHWNPHHYVLDDMVRGKANALLHWSRWLLHWLRWLFLWLRIVLVASALASVSLVGALVAMVIALVALVLALVASVLASARCIGCIGLAYVMHWLH